MRYDEIFGDVELYCEEDEFFTENYIDDIEYDEHDKEFDTWDIYDNRSKLSMKKKN